MRIAYHAMIFEIDLKFPHLVCIVHFLSPLLKDDSSGRRTHSAFLLVKTDVDAIDNALHIFHNDRNLLSCFLLLLQALGTKNLCHT